MCSSLSSSLRPSVTCSWHVEHPPPFAFVTPDQQVQSFGKSKLRQAHAHPLNLRLDDITGTRPKQHCFPTSPRLTDPLQPRYIWPLHESKLPQAAAVPSKFIKNSLDNSDIAGAQVPAMHQLTNKVHCSGLNHKQLELLNIVLFSFPFLQRLSALFMPLHRPCILRDIPVSCKQTCKLWQRCSFTISN